MVPAHRHYLPKPRPRLSSSNQARAKRRLKTYLVYIHDDRYSVPSLYTVSVEDDERMRVWAAARLASSTHYQAIEAFEDDRLSCRVERSAKT